MAFLLILAFALSFAPTALAEDGNYASLAAYTATGAPGNGKFTITGSNYTLLVPSLTLADTVHVASGETLTITYGNEFDTDGLLVVDAGGALDINACPVFTGSVVNNGVMVFSGRGYMTYGGNILGSGSVQVDQFCHLTGNNTFTGGITANSSLEIDGPQYLGAGLITLDGYLYINSVPDFTIPNDIAVDSHGVDAFIDGGTTVTLTGRLYETGDHILEGCHQFMKFGEGTLVMASADNRLTNIYVEEGTLVLQTDTTVPSGGTLEVGPQASWSPRLENKAMLTVDGTLANNDITDMGDYFPNNARGPVDNAGVIKNNGVILSGGEAYVNGGVIKGGGTYGGPTPLKTLVANANGGTIDGLPAQTYAEPQSATAFSTSKLDTPTLAGIEFIGWYDSLSGGNLLGASIPLTSQQTTIYARWRFLSSGVSLDRTSLSLAVGGKAKLSATVSPAEATDKAVTWSSDNPVAVTVDADGNLAAKVAGSATVTVKTKSGGHTATCRVTVASPTVDPIKGNTISDGGAVPGGTVEIRTEDGKIITAPVDQNGNWSATLPAGADPSKLTIVVKDPQGNTTGDPVVVTPEVKVASVAVSHKTLYVKTGKTAALGAAVYPAAASDKDVTWSSKNKKTAIVNDKGVVKGISPGKTTITVKTRDGGKTAKCTVVVVKDTVKLSSFQLNKNGTAPLQTGQTLQPAVTPAPKNATGFTVKWKSSQSSIASVDAAGRVTAHKEGKATVTATAGGKTQKVIVQVGDTAASKVKLSKAKTMLRKGKTLALKAVVTPEGTSPVKLTWESSDKKTATVTGKGVVKGIKAGKATITVRTWNGKTAKCVVTVK